MCSAFFVSALPHYLFISLLPHSFKLQFSVHNVNYAQKTAFTQVVSAMMDAIRRDI